ncbi:hypothetical protein Cantr_04792 [Candida viswanathii]|uniref:Uncharacterized protein n=1 Tax=Candida viswanathii TaxID=5486 RepID=A0A367XP96_9ASCO|nr:hypothetical protein Cantr_04792 [Candida viswanathii]
MMIGASKYLVNFLGEHVLQIMLEPNWKHHWSSGNNPLDLLGINDTPAQGGIVGGGISEGWFLTMVGETVILDANNLTVEDHQLDKQRDISNSS